MGLFDRLHTDLTSHALAQVNPGIVWLDHPFIEAPSSRSSGLDGSDGRRANSPNVLGDSVKSVQFSPVSKQSQCQQIIAGCVEVESSVVMAPEGILLASRYPWECQIHRGSRVSQWRTFMPLAVSLKCCIISPMMLRKVRTCIWVIQSTSG